MGVLARRPAPLQISYLGYPGTVGLAAIDYRIADACTEPAGWADDCSVEKILRIDDGFHCFAGPGEDLAVAPVPVANQGVITFGSFNNIAKINSDVVALWAGILNTVPEARLLLKDQRFKNSATRRRIESAFAAHGIDADRLKLLGAQTERRDHLAQYAQVDIALDPFPYNGTTTTCEALWMGVPVITLTGTRPDARVGGKPAQPGAAEGDDRGGAGRLYCHCRRASRRCGEIEQPQGEFARTDAECVPRSRPRLYREAGNRLS